MPNLFMYRTLGEFALRNLFLAIIALLLPGCGVSIFKAQNWDINDTGNLASELYRSRNLDACRQQATLTPPVTANNEVPDKNAHNTAIYASIDRIILISCMEAKGYKLRQLTDTEAFFTYITAPGVALMQLFGKNFDDVY
jgi:hypothetical protein